VLLQYGAVMCYDTMSAVMSYDTNSVVHKRRSNVQRQGRQGTETWRPLADADTEIHCPSMPGTFRNLPRSVPCCDVFFLFRSKNPVCQCRRVMHTYAQRAHYTNKKLQAHFFLFCFKSCQLLQLSSNNFSQGDILLIATGLVRLFGLMGEYLPRFLKILLRISSAFSMKSS